MNNKIVILGAGESGVGAAILAMSKGYDVFVSDKGQIANKYKAELEGHKIMHEEGQHTETIIRNATEVIISPGISDKNELVQMLHTKGTPIISEIEFAGRFTNAHMICITGSNGKTTTTMLTHHILKNAGLNVGLAGNVGKSLARQVAENDYSHYVVELSSFQLDRMFNFKADVAILLNITPDHLDRYDYQMQNYVNSKFKITQNQTKGDVLIYCADDEIITQELKKRNIKSNTIPFSIKKELTTGAFLKKNELHLLLPNKSFTMSIFELALQGKHNIYNSMAATIIGNLEDIRKDVIRDSLSDFKSVEHRLEYVASVCGIDFINDSKATNVNSTWYALESMNKPVILILGGQDKGNDYGMLAELVKDKVKAIVCLGIDNHKIHDAFSTDINEIVDTTSAEEAVKTSYRLAKKGDVVLLAPACASFDLFENFEDRGRQFKNAVRAL